MPVPSWRRVAEPSTCAKRSKTRSSWSGGMPTPESITLSRTLPPATAPALPSPSSRATRTRIDPPASVNLSALPTRLTRTFSSASGSAFTIGSPCAHSADSATPFRSAIGRALSTMSPTSRGSSSGCRCSSACLLSIFAKSSRLLISFSNRSAFLCIVSRYARCEAESSPNSPASIASNGASISVSGVRSSWCTLALKRDFASSSWRSLS